MCTSCLARTRPGGTAKVYIGQTGQLKHRLSQHQHGRAGMKTIDGKGRSISKILKGKRYGIDYYQREYRWQKKQAKELIDGLHRPVPAVTRPSQADGLDLRSSSLAINDEISRVCRLPTRSGHRFYTEL